MSSSFTHFLSQFTRAHTHMCTHSRAHMCTHSRAHSHVHTHMCTHVHTVTRAHSHTCTHSRAHTCTQTHVHTVTRAHSAHTCTHVHTHTPLLPVSHSSLNFSSTSLIHSFELQLLIFFRIYPSEYPPLFSIASSESVCFQILSDL